MALTVWIAFAALTLLVCRPALGADDAAEHVKKLVEGDAGERDKAEKKLREIGASAITALRDAKSEKEEVFTRARNVLTDITLETAKIDPADASMTHEIAREEGKGKRYANAERLYRRAEQLFSKLKSDSNERKDRSKELTYEEKRKICDRMKDKAARKVKGQTHTGVNLGFVKVGKEHDNSDEWE